MKAALIFTGSGPILVLTNFESLNSPGFVQRLAARGIPKFIGHEVGLELVQKRYGTRFVVVSGDLSREEDLRVMDIDGHQVFKNFAFEEWGPPVFSSPLPKPSASEEAIGEGDGKEWLWATIDEYGKIVEASYIGMVGSRIVPSIPMEAGASKKQARFKIGRDGTIFDGTPKDLNGHKVVLHGRSSPSLGRTDTVVPACTWRTDDKGDWTCS